MTEPEPSLEVLARSRARHITALIDHAHGVEPLDNEALLRHALLALTCSRKASETALRGWWQFAADALSAGAGIGLVGHAMGLTDEEVRVGLGRWLDASVTSGEITEERRQQVRALIGGAR